MSNHGPSPSKRLDTILRLTLTTRKSSCTNVHVKLVADTNAFLAVALEEPEREQVIHWTMGHELIAPQILPFEIGNALSAMARRDLLSCDEVIQAWKATESIPVDLRPVDIESALRLAIRFSMYAYDAYFLECALRFNLPLLTLDKGMKAVAQQLHIELLESKT